MIIALACAVAFAQPVRAGLFGGPAEPSYQGKPLGDWLLEMNEEKPPELRFEPFQHFGSNAVPFLLYVAGQTNVGAGNLVMAARVMRAQHEELSDDMFAKMRDNAVRAIGEIGPAGFQATPALLGLIGDSDGTVAESAVYSLSHVLPPDTNVVAALAAALAGKDFDPIAAGWNASYSNSPSLETAAMLAQIAVATNTVVTMRAECLVALTRIALNSPDAIPLLAQHLGTEPPWSKLGIAYSMVQFGDSGIPVTLAALKDPDSATRLSAAGNVWRRGVFYHQPTTNELVTAALISLLKDPANWRTQENAAMSCAKITRPAAKSPPCAAYHRVFYF